jgi:hypothetical protein
MGPADKKTSALVPAPLRQTSVPRKRLPSAERCGKMTVGRTGDGRPRTDRPGTNRGDEQCVAIERRAEPTPTVNVLGRRRLNMVVRRQTSGAAEKSGTREPGTEKTKTRDDKKWDGSLRSRSWSPFFCPPSFCPPLPNRYLTTVARGETKRPPSSWLRCVRPALQEKDCRPPNDAVR